MDKKTKKQHFVSQFYLKGWANGDGMILAKGESSEFTTTAVNIAHMNHMYRVEGLGEREREVLLRSAERTAEPMRGLFKSLIDACYSFHILSTAKMSEADTQKIDTLKQNIIEDFYGAFEDQVQEAYALLLGDQYEKFSINHYQDILRFVTLQLSRTAKTKEKSKEALEPLLLERGMSFKDFDTLYSAIISEQITLALIEKLYQIEVIENTTEINFITSDNPVKNLLSTEDVHVEIYWPISPRKALIVRRTNFTSAEAEKIKQGIMNHGHKAEHILAVNKGISKEAIDRLNQIIWHDKHLHAFYRARQDVAFLNA